MRLWLHRGPDAEPGWNAWCLDAPGFATWAPDRERLLARVPGKLEEHRAWLLRHGLPVPDLGPEPEVVEELAGNEILFAPDREPASVAEIDKTLQMLGCTRLDLLVTIERLPDEVLLWDPPYARFAAWADWRTINATLAHLANSETHYYLRQIGYECQHAPAPADGDWRGFLPRQRAEAEAFLRSVQRSNGRARVSEGNGEPWSVRKVLRRMIRHELLHWKSIRRIVAAFGARGQA